MFCVHCGAKLPDGARFCSNCGKQTVVTHENNAPRHNTHVWGQESAQQKSPVQQKPPVQQWSPPVQQKPPVQQWSPPVQQKPPVQQRPPVQQWPPVQEQKAPQQGYVPPAQDTWTPPSGGKSSGFSGVSVPNHLKGTLLAVIIVAVLFITAIGFYSLGSSDKPAETKKDTSKGTTSRNSGSASEERYGDDGFYFTHDEFPDLYEEVLEENGCPFNVGKSKYNLEAGYQWDLMYKNKPAIYFNTTEDPTTGMVTTVKAGHNSLTAGYEEVTDEEIDAILYIIEACHGPMSDSDWKTIHNAKPTLDTDTIDITDVELDGLIIKITETATTYSIDIYAGEPQKASAPKETDAPPASDSSVLDKFPEGTKRFNSSTFLFTHEEFADLYNLLLQVESPGYSVGNPSDVGDGKYNFPFKYQGEKVGFIIAEINSAGKVTKLSINYDFDENDQIAKEGISASLWIMQAAHGDLDDDDWEYIYSKNATAVRDNYKAFSYDLDGMNVGMLLYSDNLHLNMKIK